MFHSQNSFKLNLILRKNFSLHENFVLFHDIYTKYKILDYVIFHIAIRNETERSFNLFCFMEHNKFFLLPGEKGDHHQMKHIFPLARRRKITESNFVS